MQEKTTREKCNTYGRVGPAVACTVLMYDIFRNFFLRALGVRLSNTIIVYKNK